MSYQPPQGYPPPGYPPQPPPSRGSMLAVVIVVALVAVAGGGAGAYWLLRNQTPRTESNAPPVSSADTAFRRYTSAQVIEAFRDVQAARADLERLQNEARTYANRVVPDARGRAAQILQTAEGYKEQAIAEAKGQSARFIKVYEEYSKAKDVTRQRIYLETMEKILGPSQKLIYDGGSSGSNIVPYLPLNELSPPRPAQPAGSQQQSGGTR